MKVFSEGLCYVSELQQHKPSTTQTVLIEQDLILSGEFDPKGRLRFLPRQLDRTDAPTQYITLWEYYNSICFGTE